MGRNVIVCRDWTVWKIGQSKREILTVITGKFLTSFGSDQWKLLRMIGNFLASFHSDLAGSDQWKFWQWFKTSGNDLAEYKICFTFLLWCLIIALAWIEKDELSCIKETSDLAVRSGSGGEWELHGGYLFVDVIIPSILQLLAVGFTSSCYVTLVFHRTILFIYVINWMVPSNQ